MPASRDRRAEPDARRWWRATRRRFGALTPSSAVASSRGRRHRPREGLVGRRAHRLLRRAAAGRRRFQLDDERARGAERPRGGGRAQRPLAAGEPVRAPPRTSCWRSTCRSARPDGRPLLFEAYQRFSVGLGQRPPAVAGVRAGPARRPAAAPARQPAAGAFAGTPAASRPGGARGAAPPRAGRLAEPSGARSPPTCTTAIVQDLAGVSFSLAAQAERAQRTAATRPGAALREGRGQDPRQRPRPARPADRHLSPEPAPGRARRGAGRPGDHLRDARAADDDRRRRADLRPASADERLLFRCAQEALRNAHKHASAATARVALRTDDGHVILEVTDDGSGFEPTALGGAPGQGHIGLRDARRPRRRTPAGGSRSVAAPRRGTTVRVEVPR